MKITSKRYIVTTSAINSYLYRVLTSGVDLTQFLKNPLLFWMHKNDNSPGPYDKKIPLGRAVDVKREGDAITCALGFSESNPFAMIVYGMYEDGTLNMLSLGALPLEWSDRQEDKLPGQTGLTFTKTKAVEFSCCDVGANDEALGVQLYDTNDEPIKLADLNPHTLIALATQHHPTILSNSNHTADTLAIVNNAIAVGKMDNQYATGLLALGADTESLNFIMNAVKYSTIKPQLLTCDVPNSLRLSLNLSYDDIHRHVAGGIQLLREFAPEVYKAKYFEKHDRLPTVWDGKLL
ncbi:hypothetical protein [Mucilaginibacter sp.]|uniref:hypothetical protein n=1 Tax=Mucilaginibacter sp. TaxID=1882438 RepID=UPI0025D62222|nr:hypothetical protein [Mucilaginibacter sp.]